MTRRKAQAPPSPWRYWVAPKSDEEPWPAIWTDAPSMWAKGEHVTSHHLIPKEQRAEVMAAWNAAWTEYARANGQDVEDDEPEPVRDERTGASLPANPERQLRHRAALAYVAAYTGTWGLPLDIRADRRWGTAHMRLSDRQVDVLLEGKARDDERAAAAQDPRQVAAREWLKARYARLAGRPGFMADMAAQAVQGRLFTPRQLETLERIIAEDEARAAAPQPVQDAPGRPFPSPVAQVPEGWYRLADGTPVRVHKTRDGQRLYAERLDVEDGRGHWTYEPGLIRRLTPEQAMTLEDAIAFGKLYGICAVCGAYLVAGDSVERGIGPICAGRLA